MSNSLLTLDTLDDRRELHRLLHHLPPARRLAYLLRCCLAVADRHGNGPRPVPRMARVMVPEAERYEQGNDVLTGAVYMDIVALAGQYDLNLAAVAVDLERYVRTGQLPPLAEARLARSGLDLARS